MNQRSKDKRSAGGGTSAEIAFEQRLANVEASLVELERGELPLEEAIRKYEAAVSELRHCYAMIEAAHAKVEQLIEGAGGEPRTAPLPLDEADDDDATP